MPDFFALNEGFARLPGVDFYSDLLISVQILATCKNKKNNFIHMDKKSEWISSRSFLFLWKKYWLSCKYVTEYPCN